MSQHSPTKKIDPKLKDSVASLIRHEQAKFLKIFCVRIQCNSKIGLLKTLPEKNSSSLLYKRT